MAFLPIPTPFWFKIRFWALLEVLRGDDALSLLKPKWGFYIYRVESALVGLFEAGVT